ncbi:hypothetical protein [Pedobacter deserti]|uniref:hypothetical protein n=1 Tax=Pedobacter deserti TaxID=2817382 RepID=UPI00210E4B62|nr:hypothetical protein [Pedobacter sp. SYSU D00382]
MKKLMKVIAPLLLVLVVNSAYTMIAADFNGTWKLDAGTDLSSVSRSNEMPAAISLIMTDSTVSFERIFNSMPDPSKQVLKLNGAELVSAKGGSETKRTLTLSADKMLLTVKSKTHTVPEEGEPFDYSRTETYELEKDGKSLTLTRVLLMPDRTETAKAVYNKKPMN